MKASRRLNSVWSASFFSSAALATQDHVGQIGDQVVALGVRRHAAGTLLADVLLGHRQVALVDFDAVDLGDHRIALRRARRRRGSSREQRRGDQAERAARRAEAPARDAGERAWQAWRSLWVMRRRERRAAATCRAIGPAWQRQNGRRVDDAVIAMRRNLERRSAETALIDKDWTPSYVSTCRRGPARCVAIRIANRPRSAAFSGASDGRPRRPACGTGKD